MGALYHAAVLRVTLLGTLNWHLVPILLLILFIQFRVSISNGLRLMRTVLSVHYCSLFTCFFQKEDKTLDSKSSKISRIKDFRNLISLRKITLNSRYEFGTQEILLLL